jgi:hypothetical protein
VKLFTIFKREKKNVSKVFIRHGSPLAGSTQKSTQKAQKKMDSSQGPQKGGALQDAHAVPQRPGKVLPDPPGRNTWFKKKVDGKRPQEQMFEYAKQHNHQFMVAFDYLVDRPGFKMYASYPGYEDFLRNTLYKTEDRHFYELIQEGKPCKLYLDVEWKGPEDPEKRVIHNLVDELNAYVKVRRIMLCDSVGFTSGISL